MQTAATPPIRPAESQTKAHSAVHGGIVSDIGNNHAEMAFDVKNGALSLYVNDAAGNPLPCDAAEPVAVQVKGEGFPDFQKVDLIAIPQPGEPAGKSSMFTGAHNSLSGVRQLTAVARIPVGGTVFRAIYHFTPGRNPVFVCPMGCDNGAAYSQQGKCARCGMALADRSMAHSDHTPKHGGIFFMAPDQWHHLEGVLAEGNEFRVYIYNNFTRPLPVTALANYAGVEISGRPGRIEFSSAKDNEFLSAKLPPDVRLPVHLVLRIKFEGQANSNLFEFHFDKEPSIDGK